MSEEVIINHSFEGGKSWHLNGECHREVGPAIIYYLLPHKGWREKKESPYPNRTGGPNYMHPDGHKHWGPDKRHESL